METEDQSPVQDDYIPEKLDPSPYQDEYAPVIFSQETVSHIISVDMMSGKVNLHSCYFVNMCACTYTTFKEMSYTCLHF